MVPFHLLLHFHFQYTVQGVGMRWGRNPGLLPSPELLNNPLVSPLGWARDPLGL